jgi:hypothetical protein
VAEYLSLVNSQLGDIVGYRVFLRGVLFKILAEINGFLGIAIRGNFRAVEAI